MTPPVNALPVMGRWRAFLSPAVEGRSGLMLLLPPGNCLYILDVEPLTNLP